MELGLSKGASHFRKVAAELVQRYPEVVEPLKDGRLCITSVVELAKVITPENRAEVLPRFFHTSKKEAKEVSAELRPREAAPHRLVVAAVRPAPAPRAATAQAEVEPEEGPVAAVPRVRPEEPHRAQLPMSSPPPAKVEPLTADLRRLHLTVSKRFLEKLEAARDALSHSHPGADAEAILEAGLVLLIERAAKRHCTTPKACTRPKAVRPTPAVMVERKAPCVGEKPGAARNPRFIPAAVKREVWVRDGGRCQFRLENGELCGSTHRLQFDHVRPVALGGESTADNLRLACSAHNLLAARRIFGDALMDRYAPAGPSPASPEMR